MILFIGLWHLGLVVTAIVALAALLVATGILMDIRRIYIEGAAAVNTKREKRSAAGVKGWQTRKAKAAEPDIYDDEVNRVLRQIDAQAEAKQR